MPVERAHNTTFIKLPHRSYTNNYSIQLGRYNQHSTFVTYINNATVHSSPHTPKSQQLHRLSLSIHLIITISTLRRSRSRRDQSAIRVCYFPSTGTSSFTIRQRQSMQCRRHRDETGQYRPGSSLPHAPGRRYRDPGLESTSPISVRPFLFSKRRTTTSCICWTKCYPRVTC